RLERIKCCRGAHGRIAATVNHLLDLGEEFHLADAAPAALQGVYRAEPSTLREMVADSGGDFPNFLDHPEVERAAPDERLDRLEEMLTESAVAGADAGADEGRSLPRQRRGFVM